MSTLELELLRAGQQQQPKLTPFDYVTKLILPGIFGVALIFTRNIDPRLTWALVALAFVSFAVGFYEPIAVVFGNWGGRREDRRVAREAFPRLRKFAHQFEPFVSRSTTDTLHYIAQSEVTQGHGLRYNALALPELSVWHAFWQDLTHRLDRMNAKQESDIRELRYALTAFFDLVGTFNNQCVWKLFDGLPPNEREALTPQDQDRSCRPPYTWTRCGS